nr:sensor histidine kinase [Microbacterium bovistercoris]
MPEQRQDDTARRFGPPPGVTLYVPVVVAFLVQVPATVAVSLWMHVAPRWVLLGTVLAAASALALLAARALPGPTVAAVAAFTVADLFVPPDAGPPFIALAFAIVGAVVRGALGWALGAVGSAWLVAVVASGMSGHLWHPFRIAVTTLLIGLCFAIGVGLRTRLDRAARRRAQIVERRRASEQEERTRIARELHDVLAHSLSQIAVQSGAGLHLFDREPERAREALANIRGLAATGLDEVRSVLAILRGDGADASGAAPLTPQPQLAQLAPLVAERTGHGLEVTLEDRLDGHLPRSSVQTTAYRIVQEALTNVVRHSEAAHAVVRLHRDGDRLVVVVDDDGTGAGAGAEGGGMRGMRERAGLLGGTVEVQPGPDGGTRVRADLPWEGSA